MGKVARRSEVVTRESTRRCLASTWSVGNQVLGLARTRCVSQDEVGNTGGERNDEDVGVQAGCGAGELGSRGLGYAASGLDDSAVGADGAVGAGDRGCGVAGRRDGAGLVGDIAGGRARHGDGVDAVDSRGNVDGSVVGLSVGSEDAGDKREEEDNDGLEGTHGD